MFLSRLLFNPRSPQARRDLSAPYQMHRTLLRAFPDTEEGGPGRVLFRVDVTRETGQAVVLVQSEQPPQWEALPAGYLRGPAESKPFAPVFTAGQALIFRLRANPTRKTGTTAKAQRLAGEPKSNGHRVGLVTEAE